MSRRRPSSSDPAGMPSVLVRFSPADWSSDPEDMIDWYYFGWFRWFEARKAWMRGSAPSRLVGDKGAKAYL